MLRQLAFPRPLSRCRRVLFTASILLALVGAAAAQSVLRDVRIVRLKDGDTVRIDGRLRDPAWQRAATLGELVQVIPDEGAAPNQPTVVRICHDRDSIYLAIQCREIPGEVRGRLMQRDANLDPDDRVEFWFDTFNDHRSAYWFQIGAGGSRGDALIGNGRFNKSWDGIWLGQSRVTEEGWQAEVAIPFKTLAFKSGGETWGFNLRRIRRSVQEEGRWAAAFVGFQFFTITQGGTLSGLSGMRQGVGLDVVPYAKASASRDRSVDRHHSRTADWGLDLNYRLTTAVNLRLTYNTDFAETEVDERQTNLTRFPLFFPEKRDFFLEDAGLFEFGPSSRRPTMTPFFSRRMGRDSQGGAVPIIVGGKVTARTDDWNVGILDVYQDDHVDSEGTASDRRSLGVVRLRRNIGRESSVGMIATSGRPTEPGDAYTTGVDFRISDSRFFGDGRGVSVQGWWVRSMVDGPGGEDNAYGLQGNYTASDWNLFAGTTHIEEDFSPELGFVRRTGVREHTFRPSYTWRSSDSVIRSVNTSIFARYTTTQQGKLDSWFLSLKPLEVTLSTDDQFEYSIRPQFIRLFEEFEISDGVTIPVGDYEFYNHKFEARTSEARFAYLRAEATVGEFYSGNLSAVQLDPTVILGSHLRVGVGYVQNHVVLDEGRFTTHQYSGRVDVSFTPDLSWRNLVQYDTDSRNLGAQTRVRWIYQPGQEVFLVGVYAWQKADHESPFIPTTQETAAKILYTVRF